MKPRLINITLDSPDRDYTQAALSCESPDEGCRYHVWVMLPSLELARGGLISWGPQGKVHGPSILYKNPLKDREFDTRKLKAASKPSRAIIDEMLAYARENRLAETLRERTEAAEKAARAAAKALWVERTVEETLKIINDSDLGAAELVKLRNAAEARLTFLGKDSMLLALVAAEEVLDEGDAMCGSGEDNIYHEALGKVTDAIRTGGGKTLAERRAENGVVS